MVDYLAATDDDTRAEAVRSLQRTSGNRAVTRMLARAPVEAPAPPAEEAPRSHAPPAPQMEAAPKGKLFAVNDMKLADGQLDKQVDKTIAETKLLNLPSELPGFRPVLGAYGRFGLRFDVDYAATLEHLQIGLTDV